MALLALYKRLIQSHTEPLTSIGMPPSTSSALKPTAVIFLVPMLVFGPHLQA